MHDEMYEEITGSLVRAYGPIQVYTLMKCQDEHRITETHEHHLIVLVDDQDEVKAAIWHYNRRVDLPWVVYAVKRYLTFRKRTIDEQTRNLNMMRQPENMARIQADFDRLIAENDWAKKASHRLSAENMVEQNQYILDELRSDFDNFATALRDAEVLYPEGIPDVSDEATAEQEQQEWRIEAGRRKADVWRPFVGKGIIDYRPIMGYPVLQAGPFHVYQNIGTFDRLRCHSGFDFSRGANVPYMILFEDEALGTFDIGEMYYRYVPGPQAICRPTRSWFAQLSHTINDAMKALNETSDPDEARRLRESLAWQRKIYLRVYDAWLALGCPGAPDDNPDPAYDPSTAAVFGAFPADIEEPQ